MSDLPRRAVTQDDSLPPVEPPSAGFLVQLFLVPALIVGIIVAVWIAFHWLAQLGNDPEGYLKALRRQTEGRWQAALNLANDLRGPGGAALKQDATLASQLAGVLTDEVASGRPQAAGYGGEQARALCDYLCRALGEFAVPEAAAPLVARAGADSDPQTAQAAVEALAVLAENLRGAKREFTDRPAVVAVLEQASRSDVRTLRSSAAYALGVVGGEAAVERLVELCADADDAVRYNAAVGLARQGRGEAWETLAEMLALPDVTPRPDDPATQAERYRRAMVVVNALKGVACLVDRADAAPPETIAPLVAALERDPVGDVRDGAVALAGRLGRAAEAATVP